MTLSAENPKQLLLLGAGASYGSEEDNSIVPPLAASLFDELARFEPQVWRKLPNEIQEAFRVNFENGILRLADTLPHALPVTQRTMAAFFFRYGITRNSLYVKLGRRMLESKWRGTISTLNYERMLLMGLNYANHSVACDSHQPNRHQVEVIFPHGCCHFFCESTRGAAGAVSFSGMNVVTNGPVIAIDQSLEFWRRIKLDAFPPVMSYFEPNKYTTSGASFIRNQRFRLSQIIGTAETIAIIGVNVREEDSYIWDSLATSPARIFYCSGKQGASSFREWKNRRRNEKAQNDLVVETYWKENFDAICAHLSI